jgi:hypothetical protein
MVGPNPGAVLSSIEGDVGEVLRICALARPKLACVGRKWG